MHHKGNPQTDDEQLMEKAFPLKTNYWFDHQEPTS